MRHSLLVSSFDLIMSLSYALDLVDPEISSHHRRAAYLAHAIATRMGLSREARDNVLIAGALHDIGALSLSELNELRNFNCGSTTEHAEVGYRLLSGFTPFAAIAPIIRHHHALWSQSQWQGDEAIPIESHILHLADRVEGLIRKDEEVMGQMETVKATIADHVGTRFMPEAVEALNELTQVEHVWWDLTSPSLDQILRELMAGSPRVLELNLDGLLEMSRLYSRIIDFRSPFTASHSSGVAVSAEALSTLIGFSKQESTMMRVAGYLHDIGKLAIPAEVLDKPGKLTDAEFRIVRKHAYYTYHTLKSIPQLDTINQWASGHHETLDGLGYPFQLRGGELQLGTRILAVADIFTALSEDRPYRAGMSKPKVLEILNGLAGKGKLDPLVVSVMEQHYDTIEEIRRREQHETSSDYQRAMHATREQHLTSEAAAS